MRLDRIHLGIALGLALISVAGCNSATDSLPRQAISGNVTLDKEPLASGAISFDPADPGKPNAVSAGATIQNGSYSVPKAEGLTPGTYRVSITSTAGNSSVSLTAAPGAPPKVRVKEKIPAKYNTKSKLTSEVKEGESKSFDFELSSDKS